jgi:hydrogenase expression/formation protein HypC
MCLALPAKVLSMHDDGTAMVELGGVRQRVSMALVDGVSAGDYVVVHVGYALTRLDEGEAQKTLALFAQMEGRA